MKIEIWSDILCPFCYIGKRNFELALSKLSEEERQKVEVSWHSFELDPNAAKEYPYDIYDMLAKKYITSRDGAKKMNKRVLEMAKEAGLDFDLDAAKPTNSFDAHRLIKLAAKHGKENEASEKLFSAFFSEGKNISKTETLKQIATEIGLPDKESEKLLTENIFAKEVRADEKEAQVLGVSGVPFFVINRKYAVSGAQPVDAFFRTLQGVLEEEEGNGK